MIGFDLMYLVFVGPFLLLSFWASYRVKSTFNKWRAYENSRRYTGADVARAILNASGCADVKVEHIAGSLSDHYDPTSRTLRLSDDTFASTSVAAAGVAAHEAGHAIQHKVSYPFLNFRSAIVPLASFGSRISWTLIMIGFLLMFFVQSSLGYYAAWAGVLLFSTVVVFQLITVPVEINASTRAKQILKEMQFVGPRESEAVNQVLNAAAWTYVAAALTGVAQLLYFLFRLGAFGSSDD